MKLHRFIGPFDCTSPRITIEDPTLVKQIRMVLRLARGEELILGDGKGNEVRGAISDFSDHGVEVLVTERYRNANEPDITVTLYLAVLKKDNFELVAQKATEVGVAALVPVITARTVKLNVNETRMREIMKEAAEQSGRGIVPEFHAARSFDDALEDAKRNEVNFLFDGSGTNSLLSEKVNRKLHVGIFIGPEGGFTPDEIAAAAERGYAIASLGSLTLRAETAAIVASYSLCRPKND